MQRDLQEERETLLEIFPVEIWQLVFESLDDPNDLSRCVEASGILEQFLEPQRVFYLFTEVLKVLNKQRYLSSGIILNCRVVSKKWKCVTDNFLEIRPYHFKLRESINPQDCRQRDVSSGTHFRLYKFTINQLEHNILPELGAAFYQKHNPFPSRHLNIIEGNFPRNGIPEQEAIRLYRTYTSQFLEKVGHHYWHVVVDLRCGKLEFYKLLRKYAVLLPNLRSLYISCSNISGDKALDLSRYLPVSDVQFPTLTKLVFLSADSVPGAALNEIFSTNEHINGIEIFGQLQDGLDVTRIKRPQKLSVLFKTADEFLNLPENSDLQILHMNLSNVPTKTMNLIHIFEKLEKLGDSLLELRLEPPVKPTVPQYSQLQYHRSLRPLELPKLKKLDIQLSCNCSLDFLLGLDSLEYLVLRLDSRNRNFIRRECIQFREEVINFYAGYSDRVLECNIWLLMPHLKKIKIEVTNGTGTGMRAYKRNQSVAALVI